MGKERRNAHEWEIMNVFKMREVDDLQEHSCTSLFVSVSDISKLGDGPCGFPFRLALKEGDIQVNVWVCLGSPWFLLCVYGCVWSCGLLRDLSEEDDAFVDPISLPARGKKYLPCPHHISILGSWG